MPFIRLSSIPSLRLGALAALSLFFCALALWPGSRALAGVSIIIPPENTVEGERVLLGDIATIAPDEEADKPLAELVSSADLGPAPGPGKDLVLRRRQIENRISASGAPFSEIRWLIPDEVRLTGSGLPADEIKIKDIISDYLGQTEPYLSGVFEIVSVTSSTPPALPKGEVAYRFVPQPSSNPGYLTGTVHISVDGREAGRLRTSAQIDLRLPAVVAARDLPRGHVLGEDDLSESHVTYAQAKGALTSVSQVVGQTLKTTVRLGAPIRDRDLVQTSMVKKGETVTIIAQGGGLKISALGLSRQDGALGQTISVVNQDSKKTISAKVIGPGMVEVVY